MQQTHSPVSAGLLPPAELMRHYVEIGAKKASSPPLKLFLLAVAAGFLIGGGAVVSNTAAFSAASLSAARVTCGLLFPFGLAMVMLTGCELFTGNTMMLISVLDHKASVSGMLKNWGCVYLGNLAGNLLLAYGIVYSGQLNLGDGALAVYTIKTAAAKCSLSFGPGVALGVLCNILVCLGVLCSLTARDTAGRILGAFVPVSFFIIGGFEHCVANMYYIPAGIFALQSPAYATLASAAGIDSSMVGWGNFFAVNLLPVTIGNIIGGAGIAVLLWFCHTRTES